jgi:glycosyltransferase involved in cell wall biosynthesis/GT2 family glycosyltransferase
MSGGNCGMSERTAKASIIINTYNRGKYLNDAIRALKGLDYPDFEVIVVNGPSTDNSQAIIDSWGDSIKALTCPDANLSQSRNVGIAAAAGDIICFMDDDAAPHPQWLRRLEIAYRDPAVAGVGGFTIDNSGTRWQVRKTICDRLGNAYNVTSFFDERPLNRPGTPFFPSLLGTNSSFRASALRAIGGFDETFAYLLDETDVCLRLIDNGGKIVYEPTAIIYHQFAESHIRAQNRVARTLYPSAVSKAYFAIKHGGRVDLQQAGQELDRYRTELEVSNRWFQEGNIISDAHRFSLDEDVIQGIARGRAVAMERMDRTLGDLPPGDPPPYRRFQTGTGLRVALVSQGFPPSNDTGIARWTSMVAQGLVARGHDVHVLTMAAEGEETVSFVNGMWIHSLLPDPDNAEAYAEQYRVPRSMMAWTARVVQEVQYLKSFGLTVASFPIWDLEGLALLDDPDIATVVSLHTTYAMAKPFKPEWNARALFEFHFVDRVIAAERAVLDRAPLLLANSQAIIDAIDENYGLSVSARSMIVPHGTFDPLLTRAQAAADRNAQAMNPQDPLRLLYVGRFEDRKGFDIALAVARALAENPNIVMRFVGDTLSPGQRAQADALGLANAIDSGKIAFLGKVTREELDDAYVGNDLVLMPSRFESFGLVAIEAMAAGRTVVALAAGGLGEVATQENGCRAFVEASDVAEQMAREIAFLAANRTELRARGQKARAAFEAHFTTTQMAAGLENVYAAALAGRTQSQDAAMQQRMIVDAD